MKHYYDLKCKEEPFAQGDPVWLYNTKRKKGISPKLQRHWEGPYIVTEKINDMLYKIQRDARAKVKVVHYNRLWKYKGDKPTSWRRSEEQERVYYIATEPLPSTAILN